MHVIVEKLGIPRSDSPGTVIRKNPMRRYKYNTSSLQVTVEKDTRSDIPDIDMKKFQVHGEMPLGKFVDFIRLQIELSIKKPIFVFFKNTEPSTGALMGAIDEENKGEDGFLHITYSGEEK
ncbi:unnamed protein product, partial [Prunus brigantina]